MRAIALLMLGICFSCQLWSQQPTATTSAVAASSEPRLDSVHRVDPGQMYHRVYAIVPMIGAGTKDDPKRPMFMPAPSQVPASAVHTGVIGFQMWLSDDGTIALVEFVGATPPDLQPILSSTAQNVTLFERGKTTQADIEAAFQQYKKGFKFGWSLVRAQ